MRALKIKRCALSQCLAHFLSSPSKNLLTWLCNQPLKNGRGQAESTGWLDKVEPILKWFGVQFKTGCNCPTFALLFVCFPVWINFITSLQMIVPSFYLVQQLSTLCLFPLSFSDLLSFSIKSICLACLSVYFGPNQFARPGPSLWLYHLFVLSVSHYILLTWLYSPFFCILSVSLAPLSLPKFFFFYYHLMVWCWAVISWFAFRWIDKKTKLMKGLNVTAKFTYYP